MIAHTASSPYSCCDVHVNEAHDVGQIRQRRCYRICSVKATVLAVLTCAFAAVSYAIAIRGHGSNTKMMKMPASEHGSGSAVLGLAAPANAAINVAEPTTMDSVARNYVDSAFIPIPQFAGRSEKWPSLFCWLLMQTVNNNPMGWEEEKLVKHQLIRGIGIFQCNDWAVMSNVAVALNRWGPLGFPIIPNGKINPLIDLASWAIGDTQANKGAQSNPLNSVAFRNAWFALRDSNKLPEHDWVVKVDPDTVWFANRLREHLKTNMPGHGNGLDSVFLNNCQRFNTMQGPMEVISKNAALKVAAGIGSCAGADGSGEDHFMVVCMQQLGINGYMDQTLLNDLYCDGYSRCTDNW
eukprot:CAMPEP_0172751204 /NCGR_PEP_ID=MMETSP1074-20121228/151144_1 /TAXON_ID=2916 /ORGANISM="Ceratium fusus, Strain PA161109" /LENGTH=351 /DNA_ID=CAMNT_0013583473 /DNA_START=1 /DNA_END=1053 /DNA_ORIENTATION=+